MNSDAAPKRDDKLPPGYVYPNWREHNRQLLERYEAARRRAEEEFIATLVREWGAIEEAGERERFEREPKWVIREVEIRGEYPDTAIAVLRYDHHRDVEHWELHTVWHPRTWGEGENRWPATKIASEMLMLIRGG